MARPLTGKYNIEKMVAIIDEYTEQEGIPILKEVCYLNYWNYDTIMRYQRENDKLLQSIKRLLLKKESALEKKALMGQIDKTMAIFSLKQLGWRDNMDVNTKIDIDRDPLSKALECLAEEEIKKEV